MESSVPACLSQTHLELNCPVELDEVSSTKHNKHTCDVKTLFAPYEILNLSHIGVQIILDVSKQPWNNRLLISGQRFTCTKCKSCCHFVCNMMKKKQLFHGILLSLFHYVFFCTTIVTYSNLVVVMESSVMVMMMVMMEQIRTVAVTATIFKRFLLLR